MHKLLRGEHVSACAAHGEAAKKRGGGRSLFAKTKNIGGNSCAHVGIVCRAGRAHNKKCKPHSRRMHVWLFKKGDPSLLGGVRLDFHMLNCKHMDRVGNVHIYM